MLEGASVVGMECSTVAIGAGLDRPTEWVEQHCEALVRRYQFLSPARLVELPDGTITPRYKFNHVLYLEVPYRLLPAMRRSQIHRRIGHSGEAIYGERVGEIAAELAMHFEQGRDNPRAVKYLLQAAENATHRSAHHEAEALARRGLQALDALPATPERDRQELSFRMILGVSLMSIKGFAAAEVEEVYERALVLCARQGAASQAFMVHWLLGLFHYFRAELQPCLTIVDQLLQSANDLQDPQLVIEAQRAYGVTLVDVGRFGESMEHLDEVPPSACDPSASALTGHFPARIPRWPPRAMRRARCGRSATRTRRWPGSTARWRSRVELSHPESLIVADLLRRASPSASRRSAGRAGARGNRRRAGRRIRPGGVDCAGPDEPRLGAGGTGIASADGLTELRRGLDRLRGDRRQTVEGALSRSAGASARQGRSRRGRARGRGGSPGRHSRDRRTSIRGGAAPRLRRAAARDRRVRLRPRAKDSFTRALAIAREQRAKSWELKVVTSVR